MDTSFNQTGFVTLDAGSGVDDYANGVAVNSAGEIIVVGDVDETSNDDIVIVKFTATGTLAVSFNSTGIVRFDNANNTNDYGQAIDLDSNDKIYIARTQYVPLDDDMAYSVYSEDGVEEAAARHSQGHGAVGDAGNAIAVEGSGVFYIVGQLYNGSYLDMAIWKINSAGNTDTTFGDSGVATFDAGANDAGNGVILDDVGRILVTGRTNNGSDNDMAIWRYTSAGTLDTTFGNNGYITFEGGNGHDVGNAIAIDAAGNILVAGRINNGSDNDMAIWRYTAAGALDTSFSSDGWVVYDYGVSGHDSGGDIAVDDVGNIYVAGRSNNGINNNMKLWRYNDAGVLDTTFNSPDGFIGYDSGTGDDLAAGLAIDNNGRIVVVGRIHNGADQDIAVWRIE